MRKTRRDGSGEDNDGMGPVAAVRGMASGAVVFEEPQVAEPGQQAMPHHPVRAEALGSLQSLYLVDIMRCLHLAS